MHTPHTDPTPAHCSGLEAPPLRYPTLIKGLSWWLDLYETEIQIGCLDRGSQSVPIPHTDPTSAHDSGLEAPPQRYPILIKGKYLRLLLLHLAIEVQTWLGKAELLGQLHAYDLQ